LALSFKAYSQLLSSPKLARLSGHDTEVPLLQIYWYSSSPTPSTVIVLDSAVVLPEDDEDKEKWNCFRFKIRHVKKSVDEESSQITRLFSCPKEGRDAWVIAINQALLQYEKEKALARRIAASIASPLRNISLVNNLDSFPKAQPPRLPVSPSRRSSPRSQFPVPRPKPPV